MIGFFLKKAFFDGWDNLIAIAVLNLGFVLILLGFLTLPMMLIKAPVMVLIVTIVLIFILHFYAGGVSVYTYGFLTGKAPDFKSLFPGIAAIWRLAALFGAISSFQVIVLVIGFPFYFSMGGIIGLTAASILFWFSIFWWLVSLWLFPVRVQLDESIKGIFKKSLFLCFDNPGFSIFLGIYTLFNIVLSAVTAFLLPGASGILLSHQIALKLRMYKYDFLDENPGANRKNIPWDALLLDEKEKVGNRTLKGMIFPWKE